MWGSSGLCVRQAAVALLCRGCVHQQPSNMCMPAHKHVAASKGMGCMLLYKQSPAWKLGMGT